jgi:glutaredoxin-related protein
LKEFLSQKGVKFGYFDISEDLASLKRFLKIRDNNPVYDDVKKEGRIGIPTLLIDDEVIIGFDREELEKKL